MGRLQKAVGIMGSGKVESGFKKSFFYKEEVDPVAQRGCEQLHLVLQLTLLSVGWETF